VWRIANINLLGSETPVRLVPESGNASENNARTKLTGYETGHIIFLVSCKINVDTGNVYGLHEQSRYKPASEQT